MNYAPSSADMMLRLPTKVKDLLSLISTSQTQHQPPTSLLGHPLDRPDSKKSFEKTM